MASAGGGQSRPQQHNQRRGARHDTDDGAARRSNSPRGRWDRPRRGGEDTTSRWDRNGDAPRRYGDSDGDGGGWRPRERSRSRERPSRWGGREERDSRRRDDSPPPRSRWRDEHDDRDRDRDRDRGGGRYESGRYGDASDSGALPSQQQQIREFRFGLWHAGSRPPVDWVCNAAGSAPVDGEAASVALPYAFDTPVSVGAGGPGSGGLPAHVPSRVLVVRGRAVALEHSTVTEAFRAFGPLERVFAPPVPASLLRSDDPAADALEGAPTPWGRAWLALAVYPTIDIARHALVQCNAWGPGTEAARRMTARAEAECAELYLSGVGCVELSIPNEAAGGSAAAAAASAAAPRTALCEVTFARADAVELLIARLEAARAEAAAAATGMPAASAASVPGGASSSRSHVLVPAVLPPLVGSAVSRLPLPVEQFQASHYAFDARSGLFYEATRGFYYDAASGLYLDTTQWSYLRRDPAAPDGFAPWTPPLPPQPPPQVAAAAPVTPAAAAPVTAVALPSIATAPAAVPASVTAAAAAAAVVSLEPAAPAAASAASPATASASAVLAPAASAPLQVATAAAAAPAGVTAVCELCKRGFSSVEHLRKHEQKSDLHRQNVAAAAAAATAASAQGGS